jgi:hypothetical protein
VMLPVIERDHGMDSAYFFSGTYQLSLCFAVLTSTSFATYLCGGTSCTPA